MRSVTMFLLASSWERDFSCLSINSSTFSRQDGATSLVLGTLSHQNLQNLVQPFLDFSSLQIFTKGVKCVSFSLEFRRCVDFVSHNSANGLFNV